MPDPDCLDRARIDAYLDGSLGETETQQVRSHLAGCSRCRTIADELEKEFESISSNLVSLLRRPVAAGEFLDEPQFQRALAKADGLRHEHSFIPSRQPAGPRTQDPPCPQQLGQYQLLEPLGRGGMGTVYKALHTRLRREVALKVLPSERMEDAGSAIRFLREAEATGKLDHPNIVRATDAAEIDGVHFLVMELVEGIDLHKLVEACGPLPVADACELIRQAAVGLQHAHEHGLVHRDIKPSNLILTSDGVVKVLDLGLARLRGGPADDQGLTRNDQIMGTVDYMAPEQADNPHTADIRADVYSLGCTLYKLLTDCAVFSGPEYGSPIAKMMAHAQKPPPPPSRYRSDVPDDLVHVIDRLLAKSAADRYGTPGEVAEALKPFAEGCNLSALLQKTMAQTTNGHESVAAAAADVESVSMATISTDSGTGAPVVSASVDDVAPSRDSQPTVVTPVAVESKRGRLSRLHLALAGIAVLVLIAGGILLAQIVIRIKGKDGVVAEITVSEAHEVEVESDGKVIATLPVRPTAKAPSDAGRPATEPKQPSFAMRPEPLDFQAGEPLSQTALVPNPAAIDGVHTWTVETPFLRGDVLAAAYQPSGKLLATASQEGTIRLWEPDGSRMVRALVGHDEPVTALSFSPDGRLLASGSLDQTLRLWDVATGMPLRKCQVDTPIRSLALSPDAKRVAIIGDDKRIQLRNPETKELVDAVPLDGNAVGRVVWSPDSMWLYFACADGTIRQWDTHESKPGRTIETQAKGIPVLCLSRDGQTLLSGGADGVIRLWSSESGESLRTIEAGEATITSVAWSQDARKFVSGDANGAVRICNAASGSMLHELPGGAGRVTTVALSPDCRWLAVARAEGGLEILSGGTAKTENRIPHVAYVDGRECGFMSVAWSPDGTTLATGDACVTCLWTWKDGLSRHTFFQGRLHDMHIGSTPDGQTLAGVDRGCQVRLFDVGTRQFLPFPDTAGSRYGGVALSADGRRVAYGTQDNGVCIWDRSSGNVVRSFECSKDFRALDWSADGKLLAGVSADRLAQVWDPDSGELLHTLETASGVQSLDFSPDGKMLALGEAHGLQLCDTASATITGPPFGPNTHVWCVAFSPNAKILASSFRGKAVLWDVSTYTGLLTLRHPWDALRDKRRVSSLAWSPDSRLLATANLDDRIRIWEADTGIIRAQLFRWHGEEGILIQPEGHYRATPGIAQQLVYVVQTDTGQETLTSDDFATRYDWKNDPSKVRLLSESTSDTTTSEPTARDASTAEPVAKDSPVP